MDADNEAEVPADPEQGVDAEREHRALAWTAAAAIAAIFWLVRPIGIGILLGVLLAFITQPIYEWLAARIGARAAAAATVFGSGLTFAAGVGGLAWLFVARGVVLSTQLEVAVGAHGAHDALARASQLGERFGISSDDLRTHLQALAGDAASSAARIAEVIASATATALLGLFFALLAMHYMLGHGKDLSRRLGETLPLRPAYTTALLLEFRRVGRATLLGSVVIGIIQGSLAAFGFWISGVPEPVFFGAATAIASFVPAVGVLLVLVPAALGLAATGHPIGAIVEIVWGLVFVVGVSDYLIRPRLIRGEAKVPSLITFASLFGGVEVLGLEGVLVGPVLMSLAFAVLRLYAAEARVRRHAAD